MLDLALIACIIPSNSTFCNSQNINVLDINIIPPVFFPYSQTVLMKNTEEGTSVKTENEQSACVVHWRMALALASTWFLCAVCLAQGIKRFGKILYLTVIFPFVVLLLMLIWSK